MAITTVLSKGTLSRTSAYALPTKTSNLTIKGNADGSIIKNINGGGGYPENNSFSAFGEGCGYVDGMTLKDVKKDKDEFIVTFELAGNVPEYQPGRYCSLYTWDGYYHIGTMNNVLIKIIRRDKNLITGISRLEPDNRVNVSKWYNQFTVGCTNANYGEGVLKTIEAHPFKVGEIVFVTSGPEQADETDGVYRKVIRVEPNVVVLDKRLDHGYHPLKTIISRFNCNNKITLDGFTIAASARSDTTSAFFKYCYEVNFLNMRIESSISLAGCGKVRFVNCDIDALALNSCQDVEIVDSRFLHISAEEACFDVRARRFRLGAPEYKYTGLRIDPATFSRGFDLRDGTVEGIGDIDYTGWPSMPFFVGGNDHKFTNIDFKYSYPGCASYVSGDNIKMWNVNSDHSFVLTGGKNWDVQFCRNISQRVEATGEGFRNKPEIFLATAPTIEQTFGMANVEMMLKEQTEKYRHRNRYGSFYNQVQL